MPLTGPALTALVFGEYLSKFPEAINAVRENVETGVPPHNIPLAFITSLCEGFVAAVKPLPIKDIGGGTSDVTGIAPPMPFAFPGIALAETSFLASQGWTGPRAYLGVSSLVGGVLRHTSTLGLLVMKPNLLLGSGLGVVSPASNPDLEALAIAALTPALFAAFQASGKFGDQDVPGAPLNPTLAVQLPRYAAALAKGYASLTAQIPYVGNTSTTVPIVGVVNSGSVL